MIIPVKLLKNTCQRHDICTSAGAPIGRRVIFLKENGMIRIDIITQPFIMSNIFYKG